MRRDGLIIAGGIIGILRGAVGALIGAGSFALADEIEAVIPGYSQLIGFELLLSIVILVISIYALVKANDPVTAASIKGWGFVIIAGGVVDLVWGMTIMGGVANAGAAGFGTVAALSLIGGLLVAGATRLAKAAASSASAV